MSSHLTKSENVFDEGNQEGYSSSEDHDDFPDQRIMQKRSQDYNKWDTSRQAYRENSFGYHGRNRFEPYNQDDRKRSVFHRNHNADNENPYRSDSRRYNKIDKIAEKLENMSGPTLNLPALDLAEKKFSSKSRLYIGNLPKNATEDDLKKMFADYGETSEPFINKTRNFAFITLDYRINAEKARRELDGRTLHEKELKIRFSPNSNTIKLKNLTSCVTNELLHYAFKVFGEIEKAIVLVDERGHPTGEGLVEFVRKGCALNAIRRCNDGCFFLTSSLRPCIVESLQPLDDTEGYPETPQLNKSPNFNKERQLGPRFAEPDSFEHDYGTRWKYIYQSYSEKHEALKNELEIEKKKLEAHMQFVRFDHETEILRKQLREREMYCNRQKLNWEMRNRSFEEFTQRNEEPIQAVTRQENNLFNRETVASENTEDSSANLEPENLESGLLGPRAFLKLYQRDASKCDEIADIPTNNAKDTE